jgi:TRAP-type uncharacterized transport system substrate-binding protein
MSNEAAYAVTKAVAENFEKVAASERSLSVLKLNQLALDVGIPLHPGSAKYFREQGWIK